MAAGAPAGHTGAEQHQKRSAEAADGGLRGLGLNWLRHDGGITGRNAVKRRLMSTAEIKAPQKTGSSQLAGALAPDGPDLP